MKTRAQRKKRKGIETVSVKVIETKTLTTINDNHKTNHPSKIETRPDGLVIFCDGDKPLDEIRRSGSKQEVIIAVALRRAQEIAINYTRKYAPELLTQIENSICEPILGLPLSTRGSK